IWNGMFTRRYFEWPPHVRQAIRRHFDDVVTALPPRQFQQEYDYTAALAGRLIGTAYDGADGHVEFTATIPTSAGSKSAESLFGADMAIFATLQQPAKEARKAILAQAKKGDIEALASEDRQRLEEQVRRMADQVA